MDDAKRVGGEALDAVLRTQPGVFFAGALAAGCYAAVTLATKALFLGQLSASEASQLAEVGAGSGGRRAAMGLAGRLLLLLHRCSYGATSDAETCCSTWLLCCPAALPAAAAQVCDSQGRLLCLRGHLGLRQPHAGKPAGRRRRAAGQQLLPAA
jgi:hypothetical protein